MDRDHILVWGFIFVTGAVGWALLVLALKYFDGN